LKLYRVALRSLELEERLASWRAVDSPATAEPAAGGATPLGRARGQRDSQTDLRPIVFIHSTDSAYLKYVLAQARASNPEAPIYLLGDEANNAYTFVEHRPFMHYSEGARQFRALYKHFSTNSAPYELFCFQRWFILRDFLSEYGFQRCVYLDSDILLYAHVATDATKFANYDFTLTENINACTFFLNRKQALDGFCRFLVDLYSGKEPYFYDRMLAHYATRLKHGLPGGVCDMTAFQLYHEAHFGAIGDASQIIDDSLYDPAITTPAPGFEMENGVKKISWKNELPHGKHVATGKEITFNSLHLQGESKSLMPSLVQKHARKVLEDNDATRSRRKQVA
jgi:hypothetical protein